MERLEVCKPFIPDVAKILKGSSAPQMEFLLFLRPVEFISLAVSAHTTEGEMSSLCLLCLSTTATYRRHRRRYGLGGSEPRKTRGGSAESAAAHIFNLPARAGGFFFRSGADPHAQGYGWTIYRGWTAWTALAAVMLGCLMIERPATSPPSSGEELQPEQKRLCKNHHKGDEASPVHRGANMGSVSVGARSFRRALCVARWTPGLHARSICSRTPVLLDETKPLNYDVVPKGDMGEFQEYSVIFTNVRAK